MFSFARDTRSSAVRGFGAKDEMEFSSDSNMRDSAKLKPSKAHVRSTLDCGSLLPLWAMQPCCKPDGIGTGKSR